MFRFDDTKPNSAMCDLQSPQPSDLLWERQKLLQGLERAHKADIKAYVSGHLSPNSFHQKRPYGRPKRPIWAMAEAPGEDWELDLEAFVREQQESTALVEDMKEAVTDFTTATTSLQGLDLREDGGSEPRSTRERSRRTAQPRPVLDTSEVFLVKPQRDAACERPATGGNKCGEQQVDQGRFWFTRTHLAGLTRKDQLRMMRQFGLSVVKRQDLTERHCMSGSKVAEAHERKLKQELHKLPVQPGPSRDRLRVFSDVFSDVCDGSPTFGSLLREIKEEYDIYLNSILKFQSCPQDMSVIGTLRELESGIVGEMELEEAEKEVSALAAEARKALEENDRVRNEYLHARDRCPEISEEKAADQEVESPEQQEEEAVSVVESVQPKRQLVWRVWEEVQTLEKEIKENMVSTATTSTTEKYIRDAKTEILHLLTANEHLKTSNEDMESDVSAALGGVGVSEEMTEEIWRRIRNALVVTNEEKIVPTQ
ncbi:hypothetical protein AALO_G00234730 [Alosa alosa]|uniref:Translin-associated factor X-interacting protein 1 N-terminal domain-containing protein n=1 Tax=Alosa alosa TaxID=278164 RepID=A0AAV6FZZ0_9TELE|nr:uncharacterized protein C6orf118-like isoform X1 [Alosa alosa]KAG5266662.1 hypothetical protein AALO_G00234730 [Alosa alosa]